MTALLAAVIGWLRLPPAPPELPTNTEREHAARVLAGLEDELLPRRALRDEDRNEVGNLALLQVQAAQLEALGMSWVSLPREGEVVPVELRLRVLGPGSRLPILVDGLHRQARPGELRRVSLRALGSEVVAEIDLRFHRPPSLDEEALELAWLEDGGDPQALELLQAAGRVELLEGFEAALPSLDARSRAARESVMQHLPLALAQLDQHEQVVMSWDGELALEPALEELLQPGR